MVTTLNPLRDTQCTQTSQWRFFSQFMQNAAFLSFLANALIYMYDRYICMYKMYLLYVSIKTKAFMPYYEVLQIGFIKRPCHTDILFCSWVLDIRKHKKKLKETCLKNVFREANNYIKNKDWWNWFSLLSKYC